MAREGLIVLKAERANPGTEVSKPTLSPIHKTPPKLPLGRPELSQLSAWSLRIAALAIAAFLTLQTDIAIWRGAFSFGFGFVGVAIGVYLTFRILNFPDLTIEGSYALGGCVAIALIRKQGDTIFGNPWVATLIAVLCGALAGYVTGILNTRFKINGLLAGILVSAAIYSINLRVMGTSILSADLSSQPSTLFDQITTTFTGQPDPRRVPRLEGDFLQMGLLALMALAMVVVINWLLNTQLGFALRATGDNENMIRALGVNTDNSKILVLVISNGLIALCGCLVAQYQRTAVVTAGQGIIVTGVAAVIIGETFIPPRSVLFSLCGAVVGAIVYRFIYAGVFNLDLTQGGVYRLLVTMLTIAGFSYLAYLTLNPATPAWISFVGIMLASFVGALISSTLYYLPIILFNWTIEKEPVLRLEPGDIQIALALLIFVAMAVPSLRRNLGLRALRRDN